MEPVAARQNGSRQQDEVHLRDVWNLLLRNRWLIFLVVVLVVGSAGALTFMAVPVYESTASIRIDEDPSNVPVLDILETISTGSQVETEMEVLRSRTLAEDVVDSLALQVVLAGPRGVARGEVVERIHVETWAPPGLYRLTREGDVFTGVEESTEADVGSFTIGQPSVLPGVTFMLTPEAAEHAELRVRVAKLRGRRQEAFRGSHGRAAQPGSIGRGRSLRGVGHPAGPPGRKCARPDVHHAAT